MPELRPIHFIRFCLFLALIYPGNSSLFAQASATIFGKVTDSSGRAVSLATVGLTAGGGTFTNDKGEYSLQVKPNTANKIVFSYVGKPSVSINVRSLNASEQFRLDVMMSTDATLDDVTVQGRKKKDEISTTTIDPKLNMVLPNVSGNFESILRTLPGVSGTNELSSAYNVRGGNFDENLVYVNDVEVYRPQLVRSGQQEGLSFINPDLVSNIKFSAGGFEAKYGDKLSSVLDVEYRRPSRFGAGMSMSLLGAQGFVEGASRNGRLSAIVGVRYRSNQYVLNSLDVQGEYRPFFYDIQSLITYRFSEKFRVEWLANAARNRFLLEPQTQQTSFGTVTNALQLTVGFNGFESMDYTTLSNAFSLVYNPGKFTTLKLIASHYRANENELFTVEGAYRLDQLDNNLGSETFGEAKFNRGFGYFINHARNELQSSIFNISHKGRHVAGAHDLQWGLGWQAENINDFWHEWNYNDSAGYSVPFNFGDSIFLNYFVRATNQISSQRVSGHIQNSTMIAPASNMRLTYGIRSNYWSLNNQNVISPRVQFSFEPNRAYNLRQSNDSLKRKDLTFKAAIGYYYQPGFFRELRRPDGTINRQLQAQRSIHYVTGIDYYFNAWGRPFKFYGEVYYKQLNYLVPYLVENVRIRYAAENSSKGYAAGIDTRVNGEFIKGLESWFSLSVMQTKENISFQNENGESEQSGYIRRPTDQRVNLGIFFQDQFRSFPRYRMQLNLVYGSNLPYYLPGAMRYQEGYKIPAYRRVDIGFSRDILNENDARIGWFSKTFRTAYLSLEVFNLFQVNNTISYVWVRDVENNIYGVPQYLTSRRLNINFTVRM